MEYHVSQFLSVANADQGLFFMSPSQPNVTQRGSAQAIDAELSRHLLECELRRSLLVFWVMVIAMAVVAILVVTEVNPTATRVSRTWLGLSVLFLVAVVEGAAILWLRRRWAVALRTPGWLRGLLVFTELSLPLLVLLSFAKTSGLYQVIHGAVPLFYFVFIGLTTLYLDERVSLFAGAFAAAQLVWLGSWAGATEESVPGWEALTSPFTVWLKALILILSGGVAAFVARQIRQQVTATIASVRERDRAVSIFGQHVSPLVAELLLKQPLNTAGEERNVCIMFLDIRDFSRLASERSAPEVVDYLNALFAPLIRIVNDSGGVVNKFLGDGFMAVFGAPLTSSNPSSQAVSAALAILSAVEHLSMDGKISPTRVGIGLHTGEAVTGNIGSAERKEYTIIGDVVNLAARIEQANKAFEASLLVSEPVFHSLDETARQRAEDLGLVELKGQVKPTRLYRLA